jgi:hypothetical protein
MHDMKRFIIFITAMMPLLLCAQPRVDGTMPLRIEKVSQIIQNPVGWAFEEYPSQKWCGYYGIMYDSFKNNNKKPIWPNISSISDACFGCTNNQSVLSMQIKKTKIDTTTCYLLYVQRYWIDWDYPAIYRGRHNYKEYAIYVLPVEEYNKLWNLDTTITKICLGGDVSYCPNYFEGCKNERAALTVLNDTKNLTPQQYGEFYFYLKKENDNTIRFYPPTMHSMKGEPKRSYRNDQKIDMSKTYFEVSTITFNKLKVQ